MNKRAIFLLLCALAVYPTIVRANALVGSIAGTFNVELSGSSSYSIPIKVAPGSAGTQPKLSLNYDSQALGGALGVGWTLGGLSVITRGPRDQFVDGRPTAINLNDKDALYLDGQRIVPVSGPTGTGTERTLDYRKVNDDFTEIRQYGSDLDHSYFRVRTKGGLTLIFGNSAVVQASDTTKTTALDAIIKFANGSVEAFAESVAIDSAGNFIRFHYQSNNNGDYNISEIDYTGHASIDEDAILAVDRAPYAGVTFRYQEAPRAAELYVAGQLLRKDKRLTDIYACVADTAFVGRFSCEPRFRTSVKREQASHYKFDYSDTTTASRFLLTAIHMSGSNDSVELPQTTFQYSSPTPGWVNSPYQLPSDVVLAGSEKLGGGYRFVHFAPGTKETTDLLFAAQIDGANLSFAFKNNGPAAWVPGGTPWAPVNSSDNNFASPVPFVDGDGNDLGVILADIIGNGRVAIIQHNVTAKQESIETYLAGDKKFEPHAEYRVPFVVSRDGRIVANYRLAKWTNPKAPDLIYESEGQTGFLRNAGPGVGWQPDKVPPPIHLDAQTYSIDFDCTGKPTLIGIVKDSTGIPGWHVYRFSDHWYEEKDDNFKPPFPPSMNPEAIREIRLAARGGACPGLLVSTGEGSGFHGAYVPIHDHWETVSKTLPFDLVDSKGNASRALVANLDGSKFPGILANTSLPDGSVTAFAYTQDASGWHRADAFVPKPLIATNDPKAAPINVFVGPLAGKGVDDIAVLDNLRPLQGDSRAERYRKFGHILTNDRLKFVEQVDYAPPVAFARQDQRDLGVRFVDLHGTGLPDVIFSRLETKDGKTALVAGAYRNTGRGWVPEPGQCKGDSFDMSNQNPALLPGLCPSVPFAGSDITGDPIQFIDLDGDGFLDLLYSYRNKENVLVTKVYFNVADGKGGRKWSEQSPDPTGEKKFTPPSEVLPLASYGTGDMGVRFTKFDTSRLGVLVGFRGLPGKDCGHLPCSPQPGALRALAFSFNETEWVDRSKIFAPPVPFVSQSANGYTTYLFVQLLDVTGSGLPAVLANYQDPATQKPVNKVWLNTIKGWDDSASITLPYSLDAIYREPKTLVQFADVNGDGLPDIVMTKGDCSGCSRTWLGTGRGWIESTVWRIPDEAISNKDGDPGFRLVDSKGDGYLDVLWIRQKDDGTVEKGLRLNDGYDWSNKADSDVVPSLPFVDKNNIDQGVRLLSVTGKGLSDIVQSFAGSLQTVLLSRSRRADVLTTLRDGYGLKTNVLYQSLLEVDGADLASGIAEIGPLGWRTYERGEPEEYPKVAPIPTTYVVRKVTVDEGNGVPSTIDYRYGNYRVDAAVSRSLGFGWRESLNEVSKVLDRTEMVQDARDRPGTSRNATCIVHTDVLKGLSKADAEGLKGAAEFPTDLCPAGEKTNFAWGYKTSESASCWTILEGDVEGHVNQLSLPQSADCNEEPPKNLLSGVIFRQSMLSKVKSTTWELDGKVISANTDQFQYDANGGLLTRFGDVLSTTSSLADGSSIQTTNEYSDDPGRWLIGRITKSMVKKRGDPVSAGSADRKAETRCSRFDYATNGLLSMQQINCDTDKAVTTTYERDLSGNVVATSVQAQGEPSQKAESRYDSLGRFEIAHIDVLGHESNGQYDAATGQPLSQTDVNGLKTSLEYDSVGRLIREISPAGIQITTDLVRPAPSSLPTFDQGKDISNNLPVKVNYAVRTQVGALPPTWTLFDVKGRAIRNVTVGFTLDETSSRFIFNDIDYDRLGRVVRKSIPHEATDPPRWTTNEYDDLGRVCAVTAINGLRTETLYEGAQNGGARVTVVVDPKQQLTSISPEGKGRLLSCGHRFPTSLYNLRRLNQRTISTINTRKQVIDSSDALGSVTYSYDAGGRLEQEVGPTGATTTNSYDEFGNKIAVSDPDLGLWRYAYDPFGRVTRQLDAKGQVTTIEYDVAGRPTKRVSNDLTTTWIYDSAEHGLGKLASVSSSNGYSESYSYDEFGHNVADAVVIDHDQFVTTKTYDSIGRVLSIGYPSALLVKYTYDRNGFLRTVKNALTDEVYWAAKNLDALGRITGESFGNGIETVKRYAPEDERIRAISATKSKSRVLDLSLDYDLIGNLRARAESVEGRKETFGYDELNRLTWQKSIDGGLSKYRYDAAGLIKFKSDVGDYHYDVPRDLDKTIYGVPVHAVQSTNYGRDASYYKYDLNGNLVSSPMGHIDYTSDNQLQSVHLDQNKWVRFDYGPDGNRFRQYLRSQGESTETLYAGLCEEDREYSGLFLLDPAFRGLTRKKEYLVNGSGIFAMIQTEEKYAYNASSIVSADRWFGKSVIKEVWYLHKDQLGSVLRMTDQDGRLRKRFWYDPWGLRTEISNDSPGPGETQRLGDSWKRGFTGQEHIDAFDLIHMNGRVYNPDLGQFLSVDPLKQISFDSQAGNGYVYARNNPLRYVDPSGKDLFDDVKDFAGGLLDAAGGLIGGVWNGVVQLGGGLGRWIVENWRTIVVVAVVVAVSYFTLGAGYGPILAGMAGGAAGGAAGAVLYGGNRDDLVQAAVRGAVIGGISAAAFSEIGAAQASSELSEAGAMAAHGVVGGVRELAEGGDFWRGFISTAATKASSLGPDFDNVAADSARAAVVGGAVAELDGGKFSNGATTGAFSYLFNDWFDELKQNHLLIEQTGEFHGIPYAHERDILIDSEGIPETGFSFGRNPENGYIATIRGMFEGESTPIQGGTGYGLVYSDLFEKSTSVVRSFSVSGDESKAIAWYMQQRIGDTGRYTPFTNWCRTFSAQQFDYIKSQIEQSRREYHDPAFSR